MNFRHEWKHEISYSDMVTLRSRLSAIMKRDIHTVNGKYEVRSLYFDNPSDKALREKIDGVNCREKFRIRYYNGDTKFIQLEKKSKVNGLCSKIQTELTLEEVNAIIKGKNNILAESQKPLLLELYIKSRTHGLQPRTIVDYTREPFIYAPGNVRVTLDYNIRTGINRTDFLNPDCVTILAGNSPIIMEVKWDGFLPSVIRDIVQVPNTHTGAFSKYALCRIYG